MAWSGSPNGAKVSAVGAGRRAQQPEQTVLQLVHVLVLVDADPAEPVAV